MNKTVEEIKQEAIAKKNELLPELNNPSLTAVWLLLCNLVAHVIHTFQSIFNDERAQFEIELERQRYGRDDWYAQEALLFQLGDPLIWNSKIGDFHYELIDAEKQIIAKASVNSNDQGGIVIKVAKIDTPFFCTSTETVAEVSALSKEILTSVQVNVPTILSDSAKPFTGTPSKALNP